MFLKKVGKVLNRFWGLDDWIATIFLILGVLFYFIPLHLKFLAEVRVELISISITILIVNNAIQKISLDREKTKLILQFGSPDLGFSHEAVRILRIEGWLYDGSLNNKKWNEANLEGADLQGASLQNVWLTNSRLTDTYMQKCNFKKSNLWGSIFTGASMRECILEQANVTYADFENATITKSDCTKANFSYSNLTGANLLESNFKGANFKDANLSEAILGGANLLNANLEGANLEGAILKGDLLDKDATKGAGITKEQLIEVETLSRAVLPNGKKLSKENWQDELENQDWEIMIVK